MGNKYEVYGARGIIGTRVVEVYVGNSIYVALFYLFKCKLFDKMPYAKLEWR